MAELLDVSHEIGDLSEYDSTVTDSGDLSVDRAAKLGPAASAFGLKCVVDDTTAIYGAKNVSPPASNQIRWRFYIDPNTMTIPEAANFPVVNLRGGALTVAGVWLGYTAAGGYSILVGVRDDEGAWDKWLGDAITDAEHYVEVHLVRESGDGNDDGVLQVWIDGVSKGSLATVDNWATFALMSAVWMGALAVIPATTDGTLYLDELCANDDGSEIGVVVRAPRFRRRREGY